MLAMQIFNTDHKKRAQKWTGWHQGQNNAEN